MSRNNFFITGPFNDAQQNVENFALGVYYMHCFGATLEQLLKLEEEYEEALISCDEKVIVAKKNELAFYENIVFLATQMIEASQEVSGSQYD